MNCATSGLGPYVPSEAVPWDTSRVQHLYGRLAYGASLDDINATLTKRPEVAIRDMLQQAAQQPLPPAPEWAYWDYDRLKESGKEPFDAYIIDMQDFMVLSMERGVREKLVLFWHDHFVAQYESHSCASYHYQYFKILTEYAFGNFRDFVVEITKTPAMLFFLNGFDNRRESPNENYARELFELFTLGENNGYTQEDITEASRALTGWNGWTSYCGGVTWAEWGFDDTDKTVFGRTGNFNYETLIDVLFEERSTEIARFVCGKLYRFYVNPVVDEQVVNQLAQTFEAANFELMPMLEQLFLSAHFLDPANVGVRVKSPTEVMFNFLRQGQFGSFENQLGWGFWSMANMGQQLGQPPDVAGWPGDRSWIDTNRISIRWEFIDGFSWAVHNHSEATLPDWARKLTGDSKEPEIIARTIIDLLTPRGLVDEAAYELATSVLKGDVPSNYYETGQWSLAWPGASWQLVILLRHIGRLPEYQLV